MPTTGRGHCIDGECTGGGGYSTGRKWVRKYAPGKGPNDAGHDKESDYVLIPVMTKLDDKFTERSHWTDVPAGGFTSKEVIVWDEVEILENIGGKEFKYYAAYNIRSK